MHDRLMASGREPVTGTLSRRRFLGNAALTAAAAQTAYLAPSALGVESTSTAGLRVAVIGLRGRGGSHIEAFGSRVAAICDVDSRVLDGWKHRFDQQVNRAKVDVYRDFRELLASDTIDAVSIATPNHTHAYIAVLAAQAGKHVYLEKPTSHVVWEGDQIVHAATRYSCVMQVGTQSRSSPALHQAKSFLDSGALGKIQYAYGMCFKPRPSIGKLAKPLTIPSEIDYDLWCGPTPLKPLFRPNLHYDWHWDFDTGNGDVGNQGIHQMDVARWFLGQSQLPSRVVSIGGRFGYEDAGNTPNTQLVYLDYQPTPLLFEVRGLPHRAGSLDMDSWRGAQIGVLIQCEKGHLLIPNYYAATAFDAQGEVVQQWQEGTDQQHYDNFLAAVVAKRPELLSAPISEGHLSTTLCHWGNISHRMGAPVPTEAAIDVAGEFPLLAEALDRMIAHLEANELSRSQIRFTLGPVLTFEASRGMFSDDRANALLRREDRVPHRVPEVKPA